MTPASPAPSSPAASRERVPIGRLSIDPLSFHEAIDAVVALVERGGGGTVVTPNVDHVVQVEGDVRLRAAYEGASLSLVDGVPVLWAARLLGRPLPEKVSGSDLFVPLVARAADRGFRVFFLGGAPGVAAKVAERLRARFPALVVAGVDAPLVDVDAEPRALDPIAERIRAAHPHLVFVAFGCPKQELFMHRVARAVAPAVLVGVGAAFDFVAGEVPRAPAWMRRAGLEWLYRLAREPRRLAPRYLVRDPRFAGIVLRQLSGARAGVEAPRSRGRVASLASAVLRLDPYGNLASDHREERLRKAASPTYVANRLRLTAYEWLHPDQPWLTRAVVEWLDANLSPAHRGLEWGSGNGTRWLARRSASLVSVEHDAEWARRVRGQLGAEAIGNVDLRLVQEARYVDVVDGFPDGWFDYVVVDGLFRDRALLRSLPKLRPGGFVVFDNVNWYLPSESATPHSRSLADGAATGDFERVRAELAGWATAWTTNGVNDTAVFVKPAPVGEPTADVAPLATRDRPRPAGPSQLGEAVAHALDRDRDLPVGHRILKALRWGAQRASAPLLLAGCDSVGPGARTQGRPVVINRGRLVVGARPIVSSRFAPVELVTGPDGSITLGDEVWLNFGTRIHADRSVTIGSRVAMGPHVRIDDADGPGEPEPVVIGDDVWLAARVRVHRGVVVGAGAVIAAGSDVRDDIPPNTIAGGSPARVLRSRALRTAGTASGAPPEPVAAAAPPAGARPLAAPPVVSAAAPERRGVLVGDFNIQELARHLAIADPLGPTVEAAVAPFDQVFGALHALAQGDPPVGDGRPDFVMIWTRPEGLGAFSRLRLGEQVGLDEILAEVDLFAARVIRVASRLPDVFVATFVRAPDVRGLGMIDLRPGGLAYAVMRMNARLVEALAATPNAYVLDAQRWVDGGGVCDKLWYHAKIGFSADVLGRAAADVRAALRGTRGMAKKVVVLDLDETLWGGIVGDVGWEAIRLGGHDAVGEAYVDFQRELKALQRRGVLLAIVSKNDEKVALAAIERHPAMFLRGADFAATRINWRDKAANIAELAIELNLGLSSMVFIDDNPAERARVREALPEVFVPSWPDDPTGYAHALRTLACFDAPALSAEDAARTAMYAGQRARDALKAQVGSLDDWLESLRLVARFARLDASSLARTAQLLNKTNQMNLATRRLSEAELRTWADAPGHEVWTVSVSDRIGDSGLTGILSVSLDRETLRIEDFVLSCRVMGRRIEESMMAVAVRRARALGARRVEAKFVPTAKNAPCRELWDGSSFAHDATTDVYRVAVEAGPPAPPMITLKGEGLDAPAEGAGHAR